MKIDRNRLKSPEVYESRLNRPQDLEIHDEWNPSPSPGIPPCESPPAGEGRAGKFVVTLQEQCVALAMGARTDGDGDGVMGA